MKKILKIAVTLFLITAIVAAALAGVNAITKDKIAANEQKKTEEAIAVVLPGAQNVSCVYTGDGVVKEVYAPGPDSAVQGYAVKVAPTSGFGGEVVMMVGVDGEGAVTGISIITHSETPGLGAVAADSGEKGEAFRGSFAGLSGSLTVSDIDALSGATITSSAVVDGVNAALEYVASLG